MNLNNNEEEQWEYEEGYYDENGEWHWYEGY